MTRRRGKIVWASEVELRNPPTCDACGKLMWWHGSTRGFGCPFPGGHRDCQGKAAGSEAK